MNKLEDFIQNYNLCTTYTCKNISEYLSKAANEDYSVDLSNSINISDIVKTFVDNYKGFKEDFNNLPNLNLCNYFDILRYIDSEVTNSRFLELRLYDLKEKVENERDINLLIYQNEEGYNARFIKGIGAVKDANLDESVIKEYLSFGEKYAKLIDSYHEFRNNMIYGNGAMTMFTSLYDVKKVGSNIKVTPKLIQEIENLTISIGMLTFSYENYIELGFDLKDNGETITVKNSVIENEKYPINNNDINYILDNTYINRKYLPSIYQTNKNKTLERVK